MSYTHYIDPVNKVWKLREYISSKRYMIMNDAGNGTAKPKLNCLRGIEERACHGNVYGICPFQGWRNPPV